MARRGMRFQSDDPLRPGEGVTYVNVDVGGTIAGSRRGVPASVRNDDVRFKTSFGGESFNFTGAQRHAIERVSSFASYTSSFGLHVTGVLSGHAAGDVALAFMLMPTQIGDNSDTPRITSVHGWTPIYSGTLSEPIGGAYYGLWYWFAKLTLTSSATVVTSLTASSEGQGENITAFFVTYRGVYDQDPVTSITASNLSTVQSASANIVASRVGVPYDGAKAGVVFVDPYLSTFFRMLTSSVDLFVPSEWSIVTREPVLDTIGAMMIDRYIPPGSVGPVSVTNTKFAATKGLAITFVLRPHPELRDVG